MTRKLSLILCAGIFGMHHVGQAQTSAAPATPATSVASAVPAAQPSTPDGQLRIFLTDLLAGKKEEAVDGLLGASTRAGQKPGERENLLAQVEATLQTYGPITTFEKAATQTLGSMIIRQYYLVQHRDMVVRWEFYLVRTGTGWRVDYFAFDDQPRSWF